jgi:hypothetical protein
MRPHTVSEKKIVDAAFEHSEDSEIVVCSLPAGAGGSNIHLLGRHVAR